MPSRTSPQDHLESSLVLAIVLLLALIVYMSLG